MEHLQSLPFWALTPFILMLGAIAVLPLFASHFWEKNQNKLLIALILSVPTGIYLVINGMEVELVHSVIYDYVPFLVLLGSLFIITGGIHVSGDINSKPIVNSTFLLIGAVLASFMGTTGAAMLLIRPLLESNKERKFKVHTILFFIAIVANCGGLLTPLGDPPLFMMYLRGASFIWFSNLFKEWAFTNLLLVIIYFITDNYYWKKETKEARYLDLTNITPIRIKGKLNFIWLIGVVLGVAFINENVFEVIKLNNNLKFLRELFLILMASLSIITTKKSVRKSNKFSWEPIEEVAYLFLGIFITMVPALEYLKANAGSMGITLPHQFYYATGALSSFLDNTPTAVTFYYLQVGLVESMPQLIGSGVKMIAGIPENIMTSICIGAVFFGSMTYIGNGPNFMVKAIAESQGIKMPDFFAYMYKFSLIVLLPIFILVQLLFVH
jgi:Na+/H+ antiporter NhaD/arsenite permease-like protein